MLEHVVELCGPSFKDAAEVTGYQSPANCWSGKRRKITSVKPARPGEHVNRVSMAATPAHAYMHSPITRQCLWEGVLELKLQGPQGPAPAPPLCCHSLYLFGPSSKQKVIVSMASSSKNSVVKASHHRLSHSWGQQRDAGLGDRRQAALRSALGGLHSAKHLEKRLPPRQQPPLPFTSQPSPWLPTSVQFCSRLLSSNIL